MYKTFNSPYFSLFLKVSILGHVPPSAEPKGKGKKRRIGEGPPKHDGQNEETLKGSQLNLIV